MRKLAILAFALLLTTAFSIAQDKDVSKVEIKVTKGAGGNIGASVGEQGPID